MRVKKSFFRLLIICSASFELGLLSPCFGAFETRATIQTSQGDMHFVLLPAVAPITVMNFIQLSQDRFYNGTKFHRVARNFMIQGGDPLSREDSQNTGTGGLPYCLPAEFSDRKHVRGTLSMARRPNNPDSAGSQFFICLCNAPEFDGDYTIFGQLVEGFDVLDGIANSEVTYSALGECTQPLKPIIVNSVNVIALVPPQSPLAATDQIAKAQAPDSPSGQITSTPVQSPSAAMSDVKNASDKSLGVDSDTAKVEASGQKIASSSAPSPLFKSGISEVEKTGQLAIDNVQSKASATPPTASAQNNKDISSSDVMGTALSSNANDQPQTAQSDKQAIAPSDKQVTPLSDAQAALPPSTPSVNDANKIDVPKQKDEKPSADTSSETQVTPPANGSITFQKIPRSNGANDQVLNQNNERLSPPDDLNAVVPPNSSPSDSSLNNEGIIGDERGNDTVIY